MNYDFRNIEKKWQEKWYEEHSFEAIDFHPTKPKYYVLYEFYNISGNLHMGHLKGTIPADALARYKRFCGYNVLYPMGGDAFGLPAENAALKTGINPHDFVANGMKLVMDQSKRFGLSCDWDRAFATSDPEYYKWTQWIFLKLLEAGKAYKKKAYVNFCPNCSTVLSNEDSQNGRCDRCNGEVVQKERWVWFLKMQEYSEKLLGNIERISMPDNLKDSQRNWIGKSEGIILSLDIVDQDNNKLEVIDIFTTCIETVYGVTFVVLAPEHKLVDQLLCHIDNPDSIAQYRADTSLRSEFDRISDIKEKTGCRLEGLYAINPVNQERVPLFIADFVLANYGTGAVMAVPMHDQRDYDFAKAFGIPLIQVIEGDCSNQAVEKSEYLHSDARMMNSAEFTGLPVIQAKEKIATKIIDMGVASKTVNYRMGDWPFNRQRYWGEPFPVVFC
ncbi:MAG: class I tRNA ligase family protein, partial [Lachnospiraceae bacterium]|nr:class I tRNA ligase family protein [Lachnospiraceae bacterium]